MWSTLVRTEASARGCCEHLKGMSEPQCSLPHTAQGPSLLSIWHLPSPLRDEKNYCNRGERSQYSGWKCISFSLPPLLPPYKLWQRSGLVLETAASKNQEQWIHVPAGAVIPFQRDASRDHLLLVTASFKCFWPNFHSKILVNTLTTADFPQPSFIGKMMICRGNSSPSSPSLLE